MKTPAQLGYRMPAEWERHRATWLSWPHNPETWPGVPLGKIEPIWARMAFELSRGEEVHLNVRDEAMKQRARGLLENLGTNFEGIFFHFFPTNDTWARDHGPNFLVDDANGKLALNDWDYNAWGGKYPPFDLDQRIPAQVAEYRGVDRFIPGIILEGGSIDVNGTGSLLTTEACLLNPNRNPQFSRAEIEKILRDHLAVQNILWLGDGIVGDDTDGHIDDLTRFVARDTVVTIVEKDPSEANYALLRENLERLRGMKDETGTPLRIVEMPMPKPLFFQGQRLPASYANFYIGNEVVLVPIFEDPNDEEALATLTPLFPGRRIVGIDSRELVVGLGSFHCVTQQEPLPLKNVP